MPASRPGIINIIPHIGAGDILLGATLDQIRELLGDPDRIDIEDSSDGDSIEYHEYGDDYLSLSFPVQESRAVETITIRNKSFLFKGESLVGKRVDSLTQLIPDLKFDGSYHCYGGDVAKDYISDDLGMSLWTYDDIVDNVTLFGGWNDQSQ